MSDWAETYQMSDWAKTHHMEDWAEILPDFRLGLNLQM